MKKMIATLLALMLALLSLTAFAEEADTMNLPEDLLLNTLDQPGFVTEVTGEYLMIQTPDGRPMQVNLNDETQFLADVLAVGDFIHVTFNGMMTRSFPAQITAMVVACNKLEGIVSELTEEGFLLTVGEETFQVNATAAQLTGIQDGMNVTVYHNGMMTRSIPAQITADHVRGQAITGVVTEMLENGFTLTVDGTDIPYTVIPKEDVLSFVTPEPGLTITVITDGVMTMGLYPIVVNATEMLPSAMTQELFTLSGIVTDITEEAIIFTAADGQEFQANILPETFFEGKEIALGDFIHVTYNGQMTFSLPAQVAALKVGCYVHQGVIEEIAEDMLILSTENDMLAVNLLPGMADSLKTGETVAVYSNGVMTMSLPAIITADLIVTLTR